MDSGAEAAERPPELVGGGGAFRGEVRRAGVAGEAGLLRVGAAANEIVPAAVMAVCISIGPQRICKEKSSAGGFFHSVHSPPMMIKSAK